MNEDNRKIAEWLFEEAHPWDGPKRCKEFYDWIASFPDDDPDRPWWLKYAASALEKSANFPDPVEPN